jgi:hypothetical protein
MIESIIDSFNPEIMYIIGNITSILLLIPLIIFIWLTIKSKNIKSFQFQLMIFILMYFIGQVIDNNVDSIFFSMLPKDFGSQIHVFAAAYFTIVMLFRFYFANPRKTKIINNDREEID